MEGGLFHFTNAVHVTTFSKPTSATLMTIFPS
jgi:hypothetical protein